MRLATIGALVLLLAMPALAKFETASVVGTVHDATGAVVADAIVTLIGSDTAVAAVRTASPRSIQSFNRVNFTPPNSNRSSSAFGTITSTFDPRQAQLGINALW